MSAEAFLKGRVQLCCGDGFHFLRDQPANRYDSTVTDPPYALTSIVKRFGKTSQADDTDTSDRSRRGADGYARLAKGFMGKEWDTGKTAFSVEFWAEVLRVLKPGAHVVAFGGTRTYHRLACAIEDAGFEIRDQIGWTFGSGFPKSHNAGNGWGTALKPAWEPICLARKPLSEKTVAANVLRWDTGAINIDGCRVGTELIEGTRGAGGQHGKYSPIGAGAYSHEGRWPANIIHDGSDEVIAAFPSNLKSGTGSIKKDSDAGYQGNAYGKESRPAGTAMIEYGDEGSAARFFYTAKADADDRLGSKHPTVKPVDLMQWLCRLVTPPGGTILDPFAGTGTTGEAAFREGFNAVLIEREPEYQADIRRRMALCMAGPDERARESIKAKMKDQPIDAGPLFAGAAE